MLVSILRPQGKKTIENKFEDLKVYVNEKLINQNAKLKEICSLLLEEVI